MQPGIAKANLTQQFVEVNETAFSKILKKVWYHLLFSYHSYANVASGTKPPK
jgi:hypothetical protein